MGCIAKNGDNMAEKVKDMDFDATDGQDYKIYDPTEEELYNAYGNDLLDKVIKDINIMKHKNGMISSLVACKLCKRHKK